MFASLSQIKNARKNPPQTIGGFFFWAVVPAFVSVVPVQRWIHSRRYANPEQWWRGGKPSPAARLPCTAGAAAGVQASRRGLNDTTCLRGSQILSRSDKEPPAYPYAVTLSAPPWESRSQYRPSQESWFRNISCPELFRIRYRSARCYVPQAQMDCSCSGAMLPCSITSRHSTWGLPSAHVQRVASVMQRLPDASEM